MSNCDLCLAQQLAVKFEYFQELNLRTYILVPLLTSILDQTENVVGQNNSLHNLVAY